MYLYLVIAAMVGFSVVLAALSISDARHGAR